MPRIYVACLASYNAGTLHGRWIDAAQDVDDIHVEVTAMLAASPQPGAEEYAIHDYEGFAPITLSEYESLDRVAEIAAGIEEHGEAFAAYMSYDSYNEPDGFEEAYRGTFVDAKDMAEELVSEVGFAGLAQIPDELWPYLDFEIIARDLMQDFYSVQGSEGEHFFWAH